MGRREKPLEPTAGPVQRFAYELRKLRVDAGSPTYRVMARRVSYSAPTLSAAAAGDRLPSLPVLRAYVAACEGDGDAWERRWYEAVAKDAARDTDVGTSPYPGLARFGTADRARFHGRDDLVAALVDLTGRHRVAAVIGASGSGKSSLLRAGLIPALGEVTVAARPAAIRVLTPGDRPAGTHRALFAPARGAGDTLLVVDQFEEVFSLCHDTDERDAFLAQLLTARDPGSRLRVVLAVRADFYGRCVEHAALAEVLGDAGFLVGPMPPGRLREAVVRPAAAEGLIVERALTAKIVAQCAGEPGGLPLMAHALREVWRRRSGKTLTLAAYDAIGGVHGAVAHTAEELYKRLDEAEAATARLLLLRMVTPGVGAQDTRRPVDRAELPPGCDALLERFVAARLLTADGTTVDLAHEALLTAWPRLRAWIDADRERLRLHRALTEAAHGWQELRRDPGALYRGERLARAREAFGGAGGVACGGVPVLTALEGEFLTAAVDAHERALRARSRTARRGRALLSALAVLLCFAAVAGAVAWQQNRDGLRQRDEAEARRIVGVARTLRTSDPVTSMRLGVAAWRIADVPETREAVLSAAAQRELAAFSGADGGDAANAPRALSADGRILTTVARDRVTRWDVRRGRRIDVREVPGIHTYYADVSDDGRMVAHHGERGFVVGDLVRGRPLGKAFGTARRTDVDGRFGPGGRTFVIRERARGGVTVQVWDIRRQRKLHETGVRHEDGPFPRLSPDGRNLATCSVNGGKLVVEEVATGRRLPVTWPTAFGRQACHGDEFTFTPDGRGLAVVAGDGIRTRELRSGRQRPRIALPASRTHPRSGVEFGFSADGAFALTMAGRQISLWATASPAAPLATHPVDDRSADDVRMDAADGVIRYRAGGVVRTLDIRQALSAEPLEHPLKSARFAPDGRTLAAAQRRGHDWRFQLRDARGGRVTDWLPGGTCEECARGPVYSRAGTVLAYGADGERGTTVRLWDLTRGRATGQAATVPADADSLAVPAGRGPVVVSGVPLTARNNDDRRVGVWKADGKKERVRALHPTSGASSTLAPDGRSLLTWDGNLVDVPSGRSSRVLHGEDEVAAAVFGPDGRHLAVADDDGRITLWNARGTRPLGVLAAGSWDAGGAPVLEFSADGRYLAAGAADGTVRVWETDTPGLPGAAYPAADGPVLAIGFTGSEVRVATPHTASRRLLVDPGRAARDVCARVRGGLGRGEWHTYLPSVGYRRTC
ncbi:nSTAND1 domain-containing NTPase [Streptomyces sp. DSM 118878]